MLNQHSLEEIADIYNLLGDLKKEYEEGIQPILINNSPKLFKNPHTVPKLKKNQINSGVGLNDQNNNLHVVWQERFNDEISVYYSKLDRFGNDLINDKK